MEGGKDREREKKRNIIKDTFENCREFVFPGLLIAFNEFFFLKVSIVIGALCGILECHDFHQI